jgi:ABC-2 type transport system permease protein
MAHECHSTLIGALLTALVVAREWERGTMEALMVTPIRVREILLGKIGPYFILGMGGLLLSVTMAVWLFEVPLRGSLIVLMGVSALYLGLFLFLLSAIGIGLMISSLAVTQQQGLFGAFLFLVPAIILSGFATPIANMPAFM